MQHVYTRTGSKYPPFAFEIDEEYWRNEILAWLEESGTVANKISLGLQHNGQAFFIDNEYRFYLNDIPAQNFAHVNEEVKKYLPNCNLGVASSSATIYKYFIGVPKLAQDRLDFTTRVVRKVHTMCCNGKAACGLFWLLSFFVFVYLLFDHKKDHTSLFPHFQ